MRRVLLAAAAVLWATSASGDGGRVVLRQEAGPFTIAVFVSPDRPAAGPADVSVLVQDRSSGEVLLDAEVGLRLFGPGNGAPSEIRRLPPGPNRLFRSVAVELATPGDWRLEVAVRRGESSAAVSGVLPVAPARGPLPAIWPFLAIPPAGVALFALREALRRERKGPRSMVSHL